MSLPRFNDDPRQSAIDSWLLAHALPFDPKAVAIAAGVSIRTAYRWKASYTGVLLTVTVGGWTAQFAQRRGRPPTRIGKWTRA